MRATRTYITALLAVLGLAACASSQVAEPVHADVPTIGVLRSVPDADHAVFLAELRAQGWRDGENVRVRPADGDVVHEDEDEGRRILRDWLDEGLDLVIAYSTPHAQLTVEEVPGVPSLFNVNDPVAAELVRDPRRPDGQLTGVTFRTPADRTLHLAGQVVPDLERVGYLAPAADQAVPGHRNAIREAAEGLDITLVEAAFSGRDDVARAVAELAAAAVDAVVLGSSSGTIRALADIEVELDRRSMPAIANTDFAAFAVVVLTPDRAELRRQLARQAARLLAGASPTAIPVEDPRKFILVLNRTAIGELGLPDPPSGLLRQADLVR